MFDKSKIFYWFLMSFVVGVSLVCFLFDDFLYSEFWFFVGAVFIFALAFFCFWFLEYAGQHWVLPTVSLGALFFGVWWGLLGFDHELGVGEYNGKNLEFRGKVVSEVVEKNKYQKFELGDLEIDGEAIKGRVLVYAPVFPEIGYFDKLNLICDLQEPEKIEDFDYPAYLARQGVFSLCFYPVFEIENKAGKSWRRSIFEIKKHLSLVLKQGLREPASGVARAMILGEKQAIDSEVRNNFSRSGLSHIVAISGLHITILGGVIFWLLIQIGLGRVANFFVSGALLFLYLVLIDFPSSAVRAYAMLLVFALAFLSSRLVRLEKVLLLAAAMILLFSPRSVLDLGFQLSFLAVLGIAKFFQPIKKFLTMKKFPILKQVENILAVTLAVQVTTVPILIFNFGQVSFLSPLANLLTVWLLPIVMVFLLLGLVLSFIFPSLALIWFAPAQVLVDYVIEVSEKIAQLEFSAIQVGETEIYFFFFIYFLLIFVYILRKRNAGRS